jgi:hypothetical protein
VALVRRPSAEDGRAELALDGRLLVPVVHVFCLFVNTVEATVVTC